jgi:hypothetical protein
MMPLMEKHEHLTDLCCQVNPIDGYTKLEEALQSAFGDVGLKWVITRGGWHRLGGVVDGEYAPIAPNLRKWTEEVAGGNVDELIYSYRDSGYFITHLAGKSHYFTLPTGDRPEQFIQIEVEELQEVIERPLIDHGWFPDGLEEFLDPLDYPYLEPEPVTPPYYRFRRMIEMDKMLDVPADSDRKLNNLRRFFDDWQQSSAGEAVEFCRQWVLLLSEYQDSYGEFRLNARPMAKLHGALPALPDGAYLSGAALANAIHGYDRKVGYPFAWFFNMLSRKSSNYSVAEAVLKDQMGAYDYLPVRDLKVLRGWEERPYGV